MVTKSKDSKRAPSHTNPPPKGASPDLTPDPKGALVAAKAAFDKKAEGLRILDISEISSFSDFFVFCSAHSERQSRAIADELRKKMNESGFELLSSEGSENGRWILLDYGDVIVHIFLDAIRDYYDLDSLWSEAKRVPLPEEWLLPAAREE